MLPPVASNGVEYEGDVDRFFSGRSLSVSTPIGSAVSSLAKYKPRCQTDAVGEGQFRSIGSTNPQPALAYRHDPNPCIELVSGRRGGRGSSIATLTKWNVFGGVDAVNNREPSNAGPELTRTRRPESRNN